MHVGPLKISSVICVMRCRPGSPSNWRGLSPSRLEQHVGADSVEFDNDVYGNVPQFLFDITNIVAFWAVAQEKHRTMRICAQTLRAITTRQIQTSQQVQFGNEVLGHVTKLMFDITKQCPCSGNGPRRPFHDEHIRTGTSCVHDQPNSTEREYEAKRNPRMCLDQKICVLRSQPGSPRT